MRRNITLEEQQEEEMAASMYYYAYLNEEDIVVMIVPMPSIINLPDYIRIDSNDESLIGKWYNRATGEFVDRFFYAVLNQKDVVVDVVNSATPVREPNYILLETFDTTLIGKWFNRATQMFEEPPIHVKAELSTGQINVEGKDVWLTSQLETMDSKTSNVENAIKSIEETLNTEISKIQSKYNDLAAKVLDNTELFVSYMGYDSAGRESISTQDGDKVKGVFRLNTSKNIFLNAPADSYGNDSKGFYFKVPAGYNYAKFNAAFSNPYTIKGPVTGNPYLSLYSDIEIIDASNKKLYNLYGDSLLIKDTNEDTDHYRNKLLSTPYIQVIPGAKYYFQGEVSINSNRREKGYLEIAIESFSASFRR